MEIASNVCGCVRMGCRVCVFVCMCVRTWARPGAYKGLRVRLRALSFKPGCENPDSDEFPHHISDFFHILRLKSMNYECALCKH